MHLMGQSHETMHFFNEQGLRKLFDEICEKLSPPVAI
jgi:hypothetical protein